MASIKLLNIREFGLKVDCFEVGKEQLKDLIGYWADIDVANKSFHKLFTDKTIIGLVVETRQDLDGGYDEIRLGSWISSLDSAREVITNEYGYELSFGYKPIFEVWIVRDDAELWDEWEQATTKARECLGDCTICDHGFLPDWVELEDYRHGDIPFECGFDQQEQQQEQQEQHKQSENDVYCIRSYHVYDGDTCVLDWDGALPPILYSIRYLRSDGETTESVNYYGRAYSFYDDLEMALGLHRCTLENVESFTGYELGLSVKDDSGEDTFCADVMPVAVFYVRLPYVSPEE